MVTKHQRFAMFGEKPVAYAQIKGNKSHPNITGRLYLFPAQGGSLVWVEVQEVTDKDQKPSQAFTVFTFTRVQTALEPKRTLSPMPEHITVDESGASITRR